ncbi:hypothetical protein [Nocardioides sp. GXZ039]|uniref:hypothetical protein n=1 Tax=Nocardioides sp. GXZ039 TaxID=3136018 RepID=UPI0030F44746
MTTVKPPLDHFEQSLLTELRDVVADRAADHTPDVVPLRSRSRQRRRAGLGIAAIIGAAATIAGLTTLGGGTPAFAVENGDGGAVVVRIHELTDADGLEAALAERGIDAEVEYGATDTVVRIDGDGGPAPIDQTAPPAGEVSDEGLHVSVGEGGEDGPPADDGACGPIDGVLPVNLERDGDDYVLTLSGATLVEGNQLKLNTMDGDTPSMMATYRFGDTVCGAGVFL